MRYEYFCSGCDYKVEFDLTVENRDTPCKGLCPHCDSEIKRAIGNGGGFRLLGRGWESDAYATHLGDTPDFKAGKYNE